MDALLIGYQQRLYHFISGFVESESGREDVLFETVIRAIDRALEPAAQNDFTVFLFNIVYGLLDERRRAELEAASLTREFKSAVDCPEPGTSEWLLFALHKLPVEYRAIFMLRDSFGLDARRAAAVCGVTPAEGKIQLRRARFMLRRALLRARVESTPDASALPAAHSDTSRLPL